MRRNALLSGQKLYLKNRALGRHRSAEHGDVALVQVRAATDGSFMMFTGRRRLGRTDR